MSQYLYSHSRHTKKEAYRYLFQSIGFPIAVYLMMSSFFTSAQFEEHIIKAMVASLFVSVFLFFVLVLPNFMKNKFFRFSITKERVVCESPDSKSFTIFLSDIDKIERELSFSANRMSREIIHMKNGEKHLIPNRYGISLEKAVSAICTVNPSVKVVKNKIY